MDRTVAQRLNSSTGRQSARFDVNRLDPSATIFKLEIVVISTHNHEQSSTDKSLAPIGTAAVQNRFQKKWIEASPRWTM
jgi:hypothetical protein